MSHLTLHRMLLRSATALALLVAAGTALATDAPVPRLAADRPVDWWFAFKFNGKDFPGCGASTARSCSFDSDLKAPEYGPGFGQRFAFASSASPKLQAGEGCIGETSTDPLGATFGSVFNGPYYYVLWNDQPKGHPTIPACGSSGDCAAPWGHSKGLLAWDEAGEGLVMQVSTPSWPLSASNHAPRLQDANTLGCVVDDDVKLSQHFFALKLSKDDLASVLKALQNASVGTDPQQRQLVRNGGPDDIQALVVQLGRKAASKTATRTTLSSGVELISKPSRLNVPPWQMVSALLGGVPLRTATFWNSPKIPATTASTAIACWDQSLGKPGPVEISLTGQWDGKTIELNSGGNHAKVGVSTDPDLPLVIFGDENQQGALSGNCASSQNGRGGLFFVLKDAALAGSMTELLRSPTAP